MPFPVPCPCTVPRPCPAPCPYRPAAIPGHARSIVLALWLVAGAVIPVQFLAPSQAAAAVPGPGDVTLTLPTPGCCATGLTWLDQSLWVADRKLNRLFRMDPHTGAIQQEIPTPGFQPTGLATDGSYLWVADANKDFLYRLDPSSGIVDRAFRLPFKAPRGLAHDGTNLYLADGRDDTIYVLDPDDGTVIRSFPTPAGAVTGLVWDGHHLWAADRGTDELHLIDAERGEVLGMMKSPGPHPYGLAWDGRTLWCADYQMRRIDRITVATGRRPHLTDKKRLRVEYSMQLQVEGPDPMSTLDVFLAIPKDRPNQKLVARPRFEPTPEGFRTDRWGQEVAWYSRKDLPPGTRFEPRMTVDVVLTKVRYWVLPGDVGRLDEIPRDIREKYLADGRKYRLFDAPIRKAAKAAVGDEKNPYWMARRIFQYVGERLDYSLAGGWDAAPVVLERGSGSCSEYSFLFIALCRAAGIPARYVGGIVTRGDDAFVDNVFHRWSEIYLPRYGWIPVDADRGDQKTPRGRAQGFAFQDNTLLVTTESGGESETLDWRYNGNLRWTFKGSSGIYVEQVGELAPLETARTADDTAKTNPAGVPDRPETPAPPAGTPKSPYGGPAPSTRPVP